MFCIGFLISPNKLLYIGATKNVNTRLDDHRKKPWWHEVVDIRITPYAGSRSSLLKAERLAIAQENPRYNIRSYHPSGMVIKDLFESSSLRFTDVMQILQTRDMMISKTYLSHLLSGQRNNPSPEIATALIEILENNGS